MSDTHTVLHDPDGLIEAELPWTAPRTRHSSPPSSRGQTRTSHPATTSR